MPEIVRHLIDEERPAQPAIGAGFGQEPLSQRPSLPGRQPPQRLGAHRQAAIWIATAEFAGISVDFGQFLRAFHLGMGGQDLLDQRRARTRQPEDEDGRRIIRAPAGARGEEFGGEHRLQSHSAGVRDARAIAAGDAPQSVTARVEFPRRGVVAPVLQRLAQGETQIDAVHVLGARPGFRGSHAGDVIVSEPKGLEVGEAEPGHAIVRPRREGSAIVGDGFRLPAGDLQGVRPPQAQVGDFRPRLGLAGQQPLIEIDHRFVVTQADAGGAILLEVFAVVRVVPEQTLGFLPRLQVLLPLQQHHGVVEPCCVVVWRAREHRGQQGLGLVGRVAFVADTRQQAQGAHIVAVLTQIVPDDLLRRRQVAIGQQTVGHHHLGRQLPQHGQMLRRRGRLGGAAQHAVKLLQHVPACRQSRVEAHRLPQRLDGRRRIAKQDMAVTALLIEATEPGMQIL